MMCLIVLVSCGTQNENDKQDQTSENTSTDNNNNHEKNNNENTEDKDDTNNEVNNAGSEDNVENEQEAVDYSNDTNPVVTMTMVDGNEIEIELYPEVAPNTVNNFISLVEDGYYDGLIFHRVMPGFMIQGGDPDGNGQGGPGYGIAGEFDANDFDNDLVHDRGVISMARTQDPDSAGSQFFLMVEDSPHLDGEFAGFGRIISGIETIDEIVKVETDQMDKPKQEQTIEKMTVDTKDIDYDEPDILE